MFWLIGYNIAYPASTALGGIVGIPGGIPWMGEESLDTGYAASSDWFFQMVFVATAASIVSGMTRALRALLPC
ncbi:MAG: ammonium transporter, partial [Pseudomonadota bacterium]